MNKENKTPQTSLHPPSGLPKLASASKPPVSVVEDGSKFHQSRSQNHALNQSRVQQQQQEQLPFQPGPYSHLNPPPHQLGQTHEQQQFPYQSQELDIHAQFRSFVDQIRQQFAQSVDEAKALESEILLPLIGQRDGLLAEWHQLQRDIGILKSLLEQNSQWVQENSSQQQQFPNHHHHHATNFISDTINGLSGSTHHYDSLAKNPNQVPATVLDDNKVDLTGGVNPSSIVLDTVEADQTRPKQTPPPKKSEADDANQTKKQPNASTPALKPEPDSKK